ncbi:hypothetical protein TIFTF001_008980 [Ficus carica]|uniref:DUF4094 domain-containing protein n=1 Tax=Ficus carica TaxID=3494 RepID=A0AA88CYJ4_FICCA|nr:hypothetical protein TIFTF001_008980 [Ficus carica]
MLSHDSQTHDVIMTLYKTISSLEVRLAAARAAKADNSNEGSPVVMKPGTEQFKKCPKSHLSEHVDEAYTHRSVCLQNHVEGYHELSSKTKINFSTAVAKWIADLFIKVDDGVHINLGTYFIDMQTKMFLSSWFIGLDVEQLEHIDDQSLV